MDIYKLDSNPNKFCVKYEKVNDFTINKEKDKIFECSKKKQKNYKCYKYNSFYDIVFGSEFLIDKADTKEKINILFDGSNNTDYTDYLKSNIPRSLMHNKPGIVEISDIVYILYRLQITLNNQLFMDSGTLSLYDDILDNIISFLKPDIMDDMYAAKNYKKCMIYKDFVQSKLRNS